MEAIGYLLRLRCPEHRPFGIKTATISRDRHDFGMVPEPFGEALGGSIREEVHDAVQVQIDQNRSIVLTFAPSPIIDTQVANGGAWRIPQSLLPNAPQNRVIAGGNGQSMQGVAGPEDRRPHSRLGARFLRPARFDARKRVQPGATAHRRPCAGTMNCGSETGRRSPTTARKYLAKGKS